MYQRDLQAGLNRECLERVFYGGIKMKKYRIIYQCNTYTTEYFVNAENEETAEKKFREIKGNNPKIVSIEEV